MKILLLMQSSMANASVLLCAVAVLPEVSLLDGTPSAAAVCPWQNLSHSQVSSGMVKKQTVNAQPDECSISEACLGVEARSKWCIESTRALERR